jgi:hypothetical protein
MSEHWRRVAAVSQSDDSGELNGIDAEHFVSDKTGLQVLLCPARGPIAAAAIAVPTPVEPTDDAGLPHTLEHLCFLGSDAFPYSGTRCWRFSLLSGRLSGCRSWFWWPFLTRFPAFSRFPPLPPLSTRRD